MNIHYQQYTNNRISTRYFIVGQGKTILFFPGGGVSAVAYKELIKLLAKKYQVIGIDIPGFGNSSVPKTLWSFSDFGDYFKGFMQAVSADNVTVVGHSFSAGIGIYLAANNKRVTNLVLLDSAGLSRGKNLPSFCYSFFIARTLNGLIKYGQPVKFLRLGTHFLLNVVKHPFQQVKVFRIVNYALSQKYIPLEAIKAKTLILWGRDDEVFP